MVEFRHQQDSRLNTTDRYLLAAIAYRARFHETICDRELARWLRCDRSTVNRSRRKVAALDLSTCRDIKGGSRVLLADLRRLGTRCALIAAQTASFIERMGKARMWGEHCLLSTQDLAPLVGMGRRTVSRYLIKLQAVHLDVQPRQGRAFLVRVLGERERAQPEPKLRKPPPPAPIDRAARELAPHPGAARFEFDSFERELAEKLERAAARAEAGQPP